MGNWNMIEKQKFIWKRMKGLVGDFDRKKFSFRELVEKVMVSMDPAVFLEGEAVKTWYGLWIQMWDLSEAGEVEMESHLELAGQFISDLNGFLSGEIEKLEQGTEIWVPVGAEEVRT